MIEYSSPTVTLYNLARRNISIVCSYCHATHDTDECYIPRTTLIVCERVESRYIYKGRPPVCKEEEGNSVC